MDFIKEVLGVTITSKHWTKQTNLSSSIREHFQFRLTKIDEIDTLFMVCTDEDISLHILKKCVDEVKENTRLPVVVVLKKCISRQRVSLIKARQPFIVEDKAIYLPFMGIYLLEKYDHKEKALPTKLSPSSQVVFFYYIYSKKKDLLMNDAVQALNFSAMSITRAVEQLESLGLIKTYKKGVSKYITSDYKGKELYDRAQAYLISPTKETKYVKNEDIDKDYPLSSLPALFKISKNKESRLKMYASIGLNITSKSEFLDPLHKTPIEIWKYDPLLLAENDHVDILSLSQSLKNETDERVQEELKRVLDHFWKKYSFKVL